MLGRVLHRLSPLRLQLYSLHSFQDQQTWRVAKSPSHCGLGLSLSLRLSHSCSCLQQASLRYRHIEYIRGFCPLKNRFTLQLWAWFLVTVLVLRKPALQEICNRKGCHVGFNVRTMSLSQPSNDWLLLTVNLAVPWKLVCLSVQPGRLIRTLKPKNMLHFWGAKDLGADRQEKLGKRPSTIAGLYTDSTSQSRGPCILYSVCWWLQTIHSACQYQLSLLPLPRRSLEPDWNSCRSCMVVPSQNCYAKSNIAIDSRSCWRWSCLFRVLMAFDDSL